MINVFQFLLILQHQIISIQKHVIDCIIVPNYKIKEIMHPTPRERSRSREKDLQKKQQLRDQKFKQLPSQQKDQKDKPINKGPPSDDDDIDIFADEKDINTYKQANLFQSVTDESGYYNVMVGKVIGSSYMILDKLGKGVFGVVARAQHTETKEIFAIKILRKNQLTERSGERQYKLLSEMKNASHIMKIHDYFAEQGHLCLVCELLGMDLRTYAHKKSLNLEDIRIFAISMFIISHQLQKNRIIHADIKPDNFLFKVSPTSKMSERQLVNNIKLCDFGTSYTIEEHNTKVEEMVARYYRAPQIMLGTNVKRSQAYALDVWSIGCTLYQLYTDQFLFNGSDNCEMLKLIMETKGRFSMKMINKSQFREKYFDSDYNFLYRFSDKLTTEERIIKSQPTITSERQLMNMLKRYNKELENSKNLQKFRDFLEKCLALNPKDRMKPQQALEHPFLHFQMKLT